MSLPQLLDADARERMRVGCGRLKVCLVVAWIIVVRWDIELHRGRVLIVDDDIGIQQLLFHRLADEAFHCVVAGNGQEALEEARRRSFGLVLLDIRLPDVSGLEVLKDLSTMQPEVCVMLISGLGDLPTAVEGMKLGALDYIAKPFEMMDLMARVNGAIRRNTIQCEKRNREKELEDKVYQLEDEIRELVGHTVQSLIREHLVVRELYEKGRLRNHRVKPEELKFLAQAVHSVIREPLSGSHPNEERPRKLQRIGPKELMAKVMRMGRDATT